MSLIIYFYIAHFLSDYPFQSGKLVKFKQEHYFGVLLHSSVHLASLLVLLMPVLHDKRIWSAIALVYITHNIIDQTKVKLDKENPKHARLLYFLDQFLHWGILYVAFKISEGAIPSLTGKALEIYTNETLWLYILVLVITTYFYDVTRYFVKLQMKNPFKRDYKTMLRNAVIVTVAFGVYYLAY